MLIFGVPETSDMSLFRYSFFWKRGRGMEEGEG
jgi:hypothetical protein